jgi:hypothetical protein
MLRHDVTPAGSGKILVSVKLSWEDGPFVTLGDGGHGVGGQARGQERLG